MFSILSESHRGDVILHLTPRGATGEPELQTKCLYVKSATKARRVHVHKFQFHFIYLKHGMCMYTYLCSYCHYEIHVCSSAYVWNYQRASNVYEHVVSTVGSCIQGCLTSRRAPTAAAPWRIHQLIAYQLSTHLFRTCAPCIDQLHTDTCSQSVDLVRQARWSKRGSSGTDSAGTDLPI